MISNYLYAVGGQTANGTCLADIIRLDFSKKDVVEISRKEKNSEEFCKNTKLLKALTNQKCAPVFYLSRYRKMTEQGHGIDLCMDKVTDEIDWATAEYLIKQEGIYFFGGRDAKGHSTNSLLLAKVSKVGPTSESFNGKTAIFNNAIGEPKLTLYRPDTKGMRPSARYMHTLEFYRSGNMLVIAGGRNDQVP